MLPKSPTENIGGAEENTNNYWQTALSCIGDGVILTDRNGVITFLNQVAENLSGWRHMDAIGRPLQDIFAVVNERDRQPIGNPLEAALSQHSSKGFPTNLILISRSGNEIPIEDNIAPIIGNDDQLLGIVLVFRDISEKRAAALAHQRLAAIIESSDDIIASKDLSGIITSWNFGAERAFGYKADEIVGKHISMLVPEDHLEDVNRILEQIRQGKRVDHYVTKRRTKDGSIIDVSLTVSPIFDPYGSIVGASKVGRDITDQLRAQELQAKLASIVEFSDDIIVSKDLNGIITSWNKGAERILGYSAEEMIGKHIAILIPDDVADDSKNILERIRSGETVEHFETKRRRKDGTIIDVSLTVSPIRDHSGRIIGASKIGRNITRMKETQRALTEKEMEFRILADTIPQLAWMANPDGFIFWYNRRWLDYTGKTLADMQGWGWQSVHDPDFLPKVMQRWKQSLDTGESFEMEFPLRATNGQFRWFLTKVNPLKDESGRILRWFGTNTDITAQRQQEEALKASEARLRAVVAATPECVKIVAPDGTVEFMNHAGLCMIQGESESVVKGASVFDLIAPEHRELWRDNHKAVCEGKRLSWQFEIIGLKGQRRWMETHAVPLTLPDGKTVQLAVTRDISQRKEADAERERLLEAERKAREEAEQVSRIKDEFLATLSHELRTPLGAILGWAQIIEMSDRTSEDLDEGIEAIVRNARAQTQLIDDLLDISRIVTGKFRLEIQQIDPVEPLEAAIQSVALAAQAKGIRLEKVVSTSLGLISGDGHRIQQVIWNLLTNAIKFTPKGGKIQITARRVNSHTEISVSDTGCGIPEGFLPFVFDRFRQADSSHTRKHGGLGLGLSIVKQITELHGGSVKVDSPGDGQGSTFTVSLPLALSYIHASDSRALTDRSAFRDSDRLNLTGVKVLIVDDETDSCRVAMRILSSCGAEVAAANSADQGFELFTKFRPHVIVSDIGMPEKDGYNFLMRIRSLPAEAGGQVPAAALTAFARSEDRRKALLAGFQSHVVKPAEPAELIAVVGSLAGRTGPKSSQ